MVSVIVPCRNEGAHIEAFLRSLACQQSPDREWEVIIADGLSTDGTREFLERYCAANPRFRVIDNPGRIVSTGLNAAIRMARGEIVIRMDAHTEYADNYIRESVAVLEEGRAGNTGGAPRVKADDFRSRVLGAGFHSPFAVGGSRSHAPGYEGYVDSVHYGCWRKETLLKLGLFDETLVRNQDDELNLRLTRSGGKVWQSKRIVCWYHPRSTLAGLFRQHAQYGYWKVAVIRKHGKPASWRHLVPAAFVIANVVLLSGAAIGAAVGAGAWMTAFAGAWAAMALLYAAASLIAAFFAARERGWAIIPFMPVVFCIYHTSYGLGFVYGLFRFRRPSSASPACSANVMDHGNS